MRRFPTRVATASKRQWNVSSWQGVTLDYIFFLLQKKTKWHGILHWEKVSTLHKPKFERDPQLENKTKHRLPGSTRESFVFLLAVIGLGDHKVSFIIFHKEREMSKPGCLR